MPKGLVVVVYFPHAVQSICENKPHWAIPVIKSRHPTLWQRSSCVPHANIRQLGRTSQSRVMVKLQGLVAIQGLNYWFKGILLFLLFVGQYCWKTGHSVITSFFLRTKILRHHLHHAISKYSSFFYSYHKMFVDVKNAFANWVICLFFCICLQKKLYESLFPHPVSGAEFFPHTWGSCGGIVRT